MDLDFKHMDNFQRQLLELFQELVEEQQEFNVDFHKLLCEIQWIRAILTPKVLFTAEIKLMPKTIVVGGTSNAVLAGFDQFGKPFPLTSADTITPVSSTPADETFGAPTFNADGTATIVVTGLVATAGDSISASVGGVASSSDTLTITAPAPVLTTATLTLQ
jgi:hypothetical protein